MNDRENRRHQMFLRVRDFGLEHAADFAPTSFTTQLFTNLGSYIAELEGHDASHSSSTGKSRQGTTTRGQARQTLRESLEAISRTARAMSGNVPGLDDKFRVPRGENDQALLTAARAFAADAAPFSTQFIAHEFPADFLAELNADIADLESAIGGQASGRGQGVAANAAIDDMIDKGVATVRQLDAIMKNKYSNNPAVLAQWISVSHVERDPRRSSPAAPPTQPGAGTPPATP
jgi:hypothetical protein